MPETINQIADVGKGVLEVELGGVKYPIGKLQQEDYASGIEYKRSLALTRLINQPRIQILGNDYLGKATSEILMAPVTISSLFAEHETQLKMVHLALARGGYAKSFDPFVKETPATLIDQIAYLVMQHNGFFGKPSDSSPLDSSAGSS